MSLSTEARVGSPASEYSYVTLTLGAFMLIILERSIGVAIITSSASLLFMDSCRSAICSVL